MNELVNKAIHFATDAHKDQLRDSTTIPYILHPLEAGMIVAGIKEDEEMIAAAILHDVLEDTPVTEEELYKEFPCRVVQLVKADTENKREGIPEIDTWEIRKQETIDYLMNASTDMLIVAFADKLSNMRAIYRDLKNIGLNLFKRFNAGPQMQEWYYSSLGACFAKNDFLNRTVAFKEYQSLVKKSFSLCREYLHIQSGCGDGPSGDHYLTNSNGELIRNDKNGNAVKYNFKTWEWEDIPSNYYLDNRCWCISQGEALEMIHNNTTDRY